MISKNITVAENILDQYKSLVWKEIAKDLKNPAFPSSFYIPQSFKRLSENFWKMVSDYPLRKGKYLRPGLLLATCEAIDSKFNHNDVLIASVIQISEEWLLIHDDIEDNSLVRRGKPSIQKLYGVEQAINCGDALHVIMWNMLENACNQIEFSTAKKIKNEFYLILSRTTLGQSAELSWINENKLNFTDEEWCFIADGKTSYYTIAAPMRLAGLLKKLDNKELLMITEFGKYAGRSFQITDDILDLTGDFSGLKKQSFNDLYEGKRTLIIGYTYRNAKNLDKKRISKVLAKKREEKTEKEILWLMSIIHKYKSINYAKYVANSYRLKALNLLQNITSFKNPSGKKKLISITNYLTEREK
jgi:geranylgeranyl diphosphate synthase type II